MLTWYVLKPSKSFCYAPEPPKNTGNQTDQSQSMTGPFWRGHVEHIPGYVPMSGWFELARGVEVWIFAADSRRIPSAKAKVLDVPACLCSWDGILVQLIIRSAKIRPGMGSAMMRREHARVSSERRRGNRGGKNYHST
jgi:hypothetical protein